MVAEIRSIVIVVICSKVATSFVIIYIRVATNFIMICIKEATNSVVEFRLLK